MTLKPGLGSLKVIENYPIQSSTHDFLLTFHGNHRPISHRFRDKRRGTSKIERKSPIFPPPVYLTPPLKGFPLELCIGTGVSENWSDGAFRWSKKFSDRFSGFDTIPECVSQPASHVAVPITLNAKASSLKTITRLQWGEILVTAATSNHLGWVSMLFWDSALHHTASAPTANLCIG